MLIIDSTLDFSSSNGSKKTKVILNCIEFCYFLFFEKNGYKKLNVCDLGQSTDRLKFRKVFF